MEIRHVRSARGDGSELQIELHPALTILTGLGADGRDAVGDVLAAVIYGEVSDLAGWVEFEGQSVPLSHWAAVVERRLDDFDVFVRAADLPGRDGRREWTERISWASDEVSRANAALAAAELELRARRQARLAADAAASNRAREAADAAARVIAAQGMERDAKAAAAAASKRRTAAQRARAAAQKRVVQVGSERQALAAELAAGEPVLEAAEDAVAEARRLAEVAHTAQGDALTSSQTADDAARRQVERDRVTAELEAAKADAERRVQVAREASEAAAAQASEAEAALVAASRALEAARKQEGDAAVAKARARARAALETKRATVDRLQQRLAAAFAQEQAVAGLDVGTSPRAAVDTPSSATGHGRTRARASAGGKKRGGGPGDAGREQIRVAEAALAERRAEAARLKEQWVETAQLRTSLGARRAELRSRLDEVTVLVERLRVTPDEVAPTPAAADLVGPFGPGAGEAVRAAEVVARVEPFRPEGPGHVEPIKPTAEPPSLPGEVERVAEQADAAPPPNSGEVERVAEQAEELRALPTPAEVDSAIDLVAAIDAAIEERKQFRGGAPRWLVESANADLEAARAVVAEARDRIEQTPFTAADIADLEVAHAALADAEAAAARRMGGAAARRRLEYAQAMEAEVLERMGFPSYSAYLLRVVPTEGATGARTRLRQAERTLADAEAVWAEVQRADLTGERAELDARQADLLSAAAAILGAEPPALPSARAALAEFVQRAGRRQELVAGLTALVGAGAVVEPAGGTDDEDDPTAVLEAVDAWVAAAREAIGLDRAADAERAAAELAAAEQEQAAADRAAADRAAAEHAAAEHAAAERAADQELAAAAERAAEGRATEQELAAAEQELATVQQELAAVEAGLDELPGAELERGGAEADAAVNDAEQEILLLRTRLDAEAVRQTVTAIEDELRVARADLERTAAAANARTPGEQAAADLSRQEHEVAALRAQAEETRATATSRAAELRAGTAELTAATRALRQAAKSGRTGRGAGRPIDPVVARAEADRLASLAASAAAEATGAASRAAQASTAAEQTRAAGHAVAARLAAAEAAERSHRQALRQAEDALAEADAARAGAEGDLAAARAATRAAADAVREKRPPAGDPEADLVAAPTGDPEADLATAPAGGMEPDQEVMAALAAEAAAAQAVELAGVQAREAADALAGVEASVARQRQAEPAVPVSAEDAEIYLLARMAGARAVEGLGSVPLVLVDPLAELASEATVPILDLLARLSPSVQVLFLTEDHTVVEWAERLGPRQASVVRFGPALASA